MTDSLARLRAAGVSIWLDCPFETIQQRIVEPESRPLARDGDTFRRLYEERRAAYSHADYRVAALLGMNGIPRRVYSTVHPRYLTGVQLKVGLSDRSRVAAIFR